MSWFFPIHYFLHLVFPGVVAFAAAPRFRYKWWKIYIVWLATMLIDLDHLLVDPIFDPQRCGVGFHPLHSQLPIIIYIIMILVPNFWVRVVGIGLLWHIVVDSLDCLTMI